MNCNHRVISGNWRVKKRLGISGRMQVGSTNLWKNNEKTQRTCLLQRKDPTGSDQPEAMVQPAGTCFFLARQFVQTETTSPINAFERQLTSGRLIFGSSLARSRPPQIPDHNWHHPDPTLDVRRYLEGNPSSCFWVDHTHVQGSICPRLPSPRGRRRRHTERAFPRPL